MTQPKPLARREVLQTAAALGIGGAALTLGQPAHAAQAGNGLHFAAQSGLVTGRPKELRYEEIPGLLTRAQVTPHYRAHYSGALTRFNAIETQLDERFRGKDPLGGDAYRLRVADTVHSRPCLALRFEERSGGKALVYSADTEPCPSVQELANGAAILIHEATVAEPFAGHTTPRQAGTVAANAGARTPGRSCRPESEVAHRPRRSGSETPRLETSRGTSLRSSLGPFPLRARETA